jgi:F-type H+-transporting ATPase subunit alpha
LEVLQYSEVLRVSKLKTSGGSDEAENQLKSGGILTDILKQERDNPVKSETLVVILYAYSKKYLHELSLEEVNVFQKEIYEYFNKRQPEMLQKLREKRALDEDMMKIIDAVMTEYVKEVAVKRPKEDAETEDSQVGVDTLDKATSKK